MNHLRLALAVVFLASPACAGKLDLDLSGPPRPAFTRSPKPTVPKGTLWHPGDPRYTQGEPFAVQALATGGYAGMGVAGLAQNAGNAGKSREAAALSAGFGAIAAINMWRAWKLWHTPEDEKKK